MIKQTKTYIYFVFRTLNRNFARKYKIMQDIEESLLSKINDPSDLRKLKIDQLPQVCKELREMLIRELSGNPGHFASSLGVVELTVALHYVFDTPEDRIVWDVGHQAYGHKILTGRRDCFSTNRRLGGLKPFPSPEESPYDTNTCGHASVSISAALGMAVAAEQQGIDRHVVAVIGDGAMSGGLAFEGLNNVSSTPNNLLIILNDNDMSIDHAVGGMKEYLHHLHTSDTYNRLRDIAARRMENWGILTDDRRKSIIRFNNSVKSLLNSQQNIFEGMNIRYFGPDDGHNVTELVRTLRLIKDMKGPRLLHIHTQKGKGYKPAEEDPTTFHAPGRFVPETGERIKGKTDGLPPKFQDVFGETLLEIARDDKRVVGITPAMPTGCSMSIMMKEIPERCFDVGIAEGHAVTFSAGMAKDGLIPVCNIYSSFSQRAYDNLIHDVAISHLHVVMCLDRAGLVGEDGPTHHGAFDLAFMRPIPGLVIASPLNEAELRRLMYTAIEHYDGPMVIRYPRGRGVMPDWHCPLEKIAIGRGQRLISLIPSQGGKNENTAVLTIGPVGNVALEAIHELNDSKSLPFGGTKGITLYDMRFIKPLDEDILHEVGKNFERIITIEDGTRNGGLGSAVTEWMSDHGYSPIIIRMGLPDEFVQHGTPEELYKIVGLDKDSIIKQLMD